MRFEKKDREVMKLSMSPEFRAEVGSRWALAL